MSIRKYLLSYVIFCVSCCHFQHCCASDSETISLVQQADTLFQATLYTKAIPLYKQFLRDCPVEDGLRDDNLSHARIQLAKAFILTGDYIASIDTLEGIQQSSEKWYLLGLAYRELGKYEQSIDAYNQYLRTDYPENLPLYEHAEYELGLTFFKFGKLHEARNQFQRTIAKTKNPQLSFLSSLYLARLDLSSGNTEQAKSRFLELQQQLPMDDMLQYEIAYLLGEVHDKLGDTYIASEYYEKALPETHSERVDWFQEAMLRRSECYVKLGRDATLSFDERAAWFSRAEEALKTLLNHSSNEKAFLALGQCYLARSSCLHDLEAFQKAELHFLKSGHLISPEGQAQALLFRAEAAPTYVERDVLYRHLTQEVHKESPFYAQGWYLRGINDFEEGASLIAQNKQEEAIQVFSNAAKAFKQAIPLLRKNDPMLAVLAEKYYIKALMMQGTQEKLLEALTASKKALEGHREDRDEILYLHARIAAELEGEHYSRIAEETALQIYLLYPNGKFSDASLMLLGTILSKQGRDREAEMAFLQLTSDYPYSELAGNTFYWAARSAETIGELTRAKSYRRQLYERYPESPLAAEAYFTVYSYQEYAQGDRQAAKHLQALPQLYPDSPFVIPAWYLIGLDNRRDRKNLEGKWVNKKNLSAAIDAFHEAETAFDKLFGEGKPAIGDVEYYAVIRYRATLERALANLAIADESFGAKRQIYLEYAEEVLQNLLTDFKNAHGTYANLYELEPFRRIEEEGTYWLGQAYVKEGRDDKAEQIYASVLEKYQSGKITRGYVLSRIWYEKGLIAMRKKDYRTALQNFALGEDASKGRILSTDQRLDLWIQQSYCYRKLNELDDAFLLLSKVVNDDSISGLRIKAMYLRAEIYELQGRHEQARRQLEAASKQKGEWSVKSKEKLVKEYGYPVAVSVQF